MAGASKFGLYMSRLKKLRLLLAARRLSCCCGRRACGPAASLLRASAWLLARAHCQCPRPGRAAWRPTNGSWALIGPRRGLVRQPPAQICVPWRSPICVGISRSPGPWQSLYAAAVAAVACCTHRHQTWLRRWTTWRRRSPAMMSSPLSRTGVASAQQPRVGCGLCSRGVAMGAALGSRYARHQGRRWQCAPR
jgi:hypothetical protein|eukprot:COSAG01_NODE_1794_length_9213_cov_16.947773_5_plen_193_part_00